MYHTQILPSLVQPAVSPRIQSQLHLYWPEPAGVMRSAGDKKRLVDHPSDRPEAALAQPLVCIPRQHEKDNYS
jgi:hypothetical protein